MSFPFVNNPKWTLSDLTSVTVAAWHDTEHVEVDGSNGITKFVDQSTNGYDATPNSSKAVLTAGVFNGLPGAVFTGASSQYYKFANPGTPTIIVDKDTAFAVYVVGSVTKSYLGNFPSIYSLAVDAAKSCGFIFNNSASGLYPYFVTAGGEGSGHPGPGIDALNGWDQPYAVLAEYNGGGDFSVASNWKFNNRGFDVPSVASIGDADSSAAGNLIGSYAGGSNLYDGALAMVATMIGTLDETDRANLIRYGRRKYNASGSGTWVPNVEPQINWFFRSDDVFTSGSTCLTWKDQSNQIDPDTVTTAQRRSMDFAFNPFGAGTLTKPTLVTSWQNGKDALYFDVNSSGYMGAPSTIPEEPGPAHWRSWTPSKPFQVWEVGEFDEIPDGDNAELQWMSENPDTEDGLLIVVSNNAGIPEFLIGTSFGHAVKVDGYYSAGKFTEKHCLLVEYNPLAGSGVADPACWRVTWIPVGGPPETLTVEATTIDLGITNLNKIATGAESPSQAPGNRGECGQMSGGRPMTSQQRAFFFNYMKSYWNFG